ncbi:SEC14L3 protein, putative [Ixodes scapularis]|uniref:SEC14L3 protein, putative n=1 Tax=Ixodes scapularis TaxID=6945 RepID=B7Q959_IXOSC|nr:SEC14L3 protein, putative [Ixodes scapularis]|eukprot:XP_002405631.1 SEC14L3 protein, putative [Ixodes scapularis]
MYGLHKIKLKEYLLCRNRPLELWEEKDAVAEVVDGGEVPQKYYRSFSKPSGGCITAFQEDVGHGTFSAFVVVDRQSSLDVPVKVDKEGSQLTWEFFGEDVIFGVFYQEEGAGEQVNDNVTEVVKPSRIKGLGKVAETGIVTCSKTGTYLLRFDNSFSWLTSKKISYCVRLTAPS